MRFMILVVALVTTTLTGCSSLAAGPALDGSNWQLTGWADTGVDPLPFGITATFTAEQMAGQTGVNRYSGSYRLSHGDRLTLEPVAGTRMAGPPEAMEAEQAFFRLLEQVQTYRRAGDELTLADADRRPLLTFRATP